MAPRTRPVKYDPELALKEAEGRQHSNAIPVCIFVPPRLLQRPRPNQSQNARGLDRRCHCITWVPATAQASIFFHARAHGSSTSCASSLMARRPLLPLLSLALLLLAALSSSSVVCVAVEPRHSEAPAMAPAMAAGRVHVAPAAAGMSRNAATSTRAVKERRRSARRGRGGGTGAWAFSAMLPRGFVPPSGSSACHNDLLAAADEYFTCGGAGSP
jgi:hypothetical protein